ncbi:hypothetical protein AX17_003887 [Amanita inopinata Kibby_2008]|nr:hypothetical protein AX17_003887 [Amanita inopinata Kibby_2008]
MPVTVDIPQSVGSDIRKFRLAKRSQDAISALVVKINKKELVMETEERFDNISIEELAEELPENAPRYVLLSYQLSYPDGRKSYPLVLINWAPSTSEIGFLTLHASALLDFQNTADVSRVIEIRDGPETLTTKAIDEVLMSH